MAPEARQDDEPLVRSSQRGDREAFSALVMRHQDRIYGTIHRMVSDPEKAMDLTQETFLKAWKGIESFGGQSAFFTWLYRIARNVVASAGRYEAVRPRVRVSLDGPVGDDGAAPALGLAHPGGRPDAALLASERREMVAAAILRLAPEHREVVVLRDIQDLAYEEIAELTEVPIGTVRSRLHRARQELKDALTALWGE